MVYKPISRRYRPLKFSQVVGQAKIVETLKNAIKLGKVSHAYIFAGPRGVGKTTTARILARALNCANIEDGEPCNACDSCLQIIKGVFPDVIEVDAASNRGIDHIRSLRENVQYSPAKGRKKVYIIDEFHMLTKEAFNALLKTLEEPPDHVVFVLATTEVDKIPATILSRCQKFIFKRVPEKLIVNLLKDICVREGVVCTDKALELIAVSSEGCLRDAESILEQAIVYGNGNVDESAVSKFLGIVDSSKLLNVLKLSFGGNAKELSHVLEDFESSGYDAVSLLKQIIYWIEKEYVSSAGSFSDEELLAAFDILSKSYATIVQHPFPFPALFFTLMKLSYFSDVKRIVDASIGNVLVASSTMETSVKKSNDEIIPDPEVNEKVNMVLDMFNAKIISGYPRRK